MELDLGGIEKIADASPDDVRHYLKFMPTQSPWVILSESDGSFIQSIYSNDCYRVEYKCEGQQFWVKVDYEKAVALFLCFMDESCDISLQTSWKRLTVFNTPFHPIAVGLACVLLSAFIIFSVLDEFGLL